MTSPSSAAGTAWPAVRGSSVRFLWTCRAAAVVALGYGLTVVLLAVREVDPSVWLWVALVVGGLVHLAGVAGLWVLPPLSPRWLRSEAGSAPDRKAARTALAAHADLDPEQRRLVSVEVAATARVPVIAAAAFALLGPVAMGTPNTAHPQHWLGPTVAVLVLLVLVVMAVQVRSVRRLQHDAARAGVLPTVDGEDTVSYLP